MMLLQSEVLQVGSTVVSLATLGLVGRLVFSAGKLFEKVEAHAIRLEHLEKVKCPHSECPLLRNRLEHQQG